MSRADDKFLRSQAIRRTGGPRFVIRCARQWKGRGRDNLPLVDLWNYIINGGLSERRSTRCDRRGGPQPADDPGAPAGALLGADRAAGDPAPQRSPVRTKRTRADHRVIRTAALLGEVQRRPADAQSGPKHVVQDGLHGGGIDGAAERESDHQAAGCAGTGLRCRGRPERTNQASLLQAFYTTSGDITG